MASRELTALIHLLTSRPIPENATVAERRQGFDLLAAKFPIVSDITCETVDAAGVPAAWVVAPGVARERVLLYLHGGGYVIGSITTHRDLAGRLSRAAAARVLLIDYRLAPEHPYPAAVDDATTAYRWLLRHGATPARTVIAGDSAGGGLTVAALVALREAAAMKEKERGGGRPARSAARAKRVEPETPNVEAPLGEASAENGTPIYHEVKPGETLFRLSRQYRVDVAKIKSWNNLPDNTISVGQELIVGYE